MENIENIIKSHNAKVLKEDGKAKTRSCNCPESKKDSCPLNGHCLSTNIVYKAEVKSKKPTKIYYGICEPTFKKRLANHKTSFIYRDGAVFYSAQYISLAIFFSLHSLVI